jgi:1-acyl-sn-glycerol-3-phosphate acyltransferase
MISQLTDSPSRPIVSRRPPVLPPSLPRRNGTVLRKLGGFLLTRVMAWRIEGNFPDVPKMVVIVAPHTSNWDFAVGFLAYLALDIDVTWFGKHTIFTWPFGPFLRHFGGVPITRGHSASVVDAYVEEFDRRDRMVLAIAPEGTRKKVRSWKSGFYRIAVGASIPIIPVAIDYGRRVLRIDEPFEPTGSFDDDLPLIRARYEGVVARHPDQF